MRSIKFSVYFLTLFSIFIHGANYAVAGNDFEKGEIVCAPKNSRCGLLVNCQEDTCQVLATHSINNNLPVKIKPEYMGMEYFKKSSLYGSDKTLGSINNETKKQIERNKSKLNKYQKVCYELAYENSNETETRCGSITRCNKTQCIINETHKKINVLDNKGQQAFTAAEIPYTYRIDREVKIENITTDGPVIEDLILWENINNVLIKVLL